MADYIITKNKSAVQTGAVVVDSVKDATVITSSSVVVYESSKDSEFDLLIFLVRTVKAHSAKNIAVVSDEVSPLLNELIKALDVLYVPDSAMVLDSELYAELLQELDVRADLLEEKWSLTKVIGYLESFEESVTSKLPKHESLLLSSIIADLKENGNSKKYEEDFRAQLRDLIDTFIVKDAHMEEKYNTLKESHNEGVSSSLLSIADNIQSYPPYTYTGTSKVLLIKEVTPCMYLTSFAVALRDFLSKDADVRTALIIVDRQSDYVTKRYREYRNLSSGQLKENSSTLFLSDVVYTTTPTKNVLDMFFERRTDKVYIVIDRTYYKANIITGRHVKVVNATSSYSLMRHLNLNAKETIVNNAGANDQLLVLSPLVNYRKDVSSRIQTYKTSYETPMKQFAKLIGVGELLHR